MVKEPIKILVNNLNFFSYQLDLLREQTADKNSQYGKEITEIMKKGELVTDEL